MKGSSDNKRQNKLAAQQPVPRLQRLSSEWGSARIAVNGETNAQGTHSG